MKSIIPQVNFVGVNTNLVAVCSRYISFVSLCTRRVEVHVHARSDNKAMLTFVWTSKNPRSSPSVLKKKKTKKKKNN